MRRQVFVTADAAAPGALTVVVLDLVAADPLAGRRRRCVLIALGGSLTGEHRYHLQRELTRLSERRSANLVLDMSGIDEVDQVGLDALRDTATWLESAGCWLTMVDLSPVLRRRLRRRPGAPLR